MPAAEKLIGVRDKTEWAKKHIVYLNEAIQSFLKSDPYHVAPKGDPNTGQLRYYVTHAEPAPASIALVAGDAIHNIRSALDHLAYQLFLIGPGSGSGFDEHIY